jgi:uncharacterized protein (DUF1330 family)
MKKGYVIGQITITDAEKYKKYALNTEDIIKKFGGKYLVRGAAQDIKEGNPSENRDVVVEFESIDQANAFYNSEEYNQIIDIRKDNSKGYIMIVEGY